MDSPNRASWSTGSTGNPSRRHRQDVPVINALESPQSPHRHLKIARRTPTTPEGVGGRVGFVLELGGHSSSPSRDPYKGRDAAVQEEEICRMEVPASIEDADPTSTKETSAAAQSSSRVKQIKELPCGLCQTAAPRLYNLGIGERSVVIHALLDVPQGIESTKLKCCKACLAAMTRGDEKEKTFVSANLQMIPMFPDLVDDPICSIGGASKDVRSRINAYRADYLKRGIMAIPTGIVDTRRRVEKKISFLPKRPGEYIWIPNSRYDRIIEGPYTLIKGEGEHLLIQDPARAHRPFSIPRSRANASLETPMERLAAGERDRLLLKTAVLTHESKASALNERKATVLAASLQEIIEKKDKAVRQQEKQVLQANRSIRKTEEEAALRVYVEQSRIAALTGSVAELTTEVERARAEKNRATERADAGLHEAASKVREATRSAENAQHRAAAAEKSKAEAYQKGGEHLVATVESLRSELANKAAEVARLRGEATQVALRTKALAERELQCDAATSRAVHLAASCQQEVLQSQLYAKDLEMQLRKLIDGAAAAKAAEKDILTRERQCDADAARSLRMVAIAQGEVVEVKARNRILEAKTEALRQQVYQLRMQLDSRPREEPRHDRTTRLSSAMELENQADVSRKCAASVLLAALHTIDGWDGTSWPSALQPSDREDDRSHVTATGPLAALAFLLKGVVEESGSLAAVSVVERMLSADFIRHSGILLNHDIREFSSTYQRGSWGELLSRAPKSVVIFLGELYQTRKDGSDLGPFRDSQVNCRKTTTLLSLMYTLNQQRREQLHDDLARAVLGSSSRTDILRYLSQMGVATPRTTALGSPEENVTKDKRIFNGILDLWLQHGGHLRKTFDNVDVRDIHALLGIVSLMDAPVPGQRVAPSVPVCEQTDSYLLTENSDESSEARKQAISRRQRGVLAAADVSQNDTVRLLSSSSGAVQELIAQRNIERSTSRRGRKSSSGTQGSVGADLSEMNSATVVLEYGTLKVADQVRVLYVLREASLAVVRPDCSANAEYVPLCIITGRPEDAPSSDRDLAHPFTTSAAADGFREQVASHEYVRDRDSNIVRRCALWSDENSDLPVPRLPSTLLFLSMEDAKASDLQSIYASCAKWDAMLGQAVRRSGRLDVIQIDQSDGQEYLLIHKARDATRKSIRDEIRRIEVALQQKDITPHAIQDLTSRKLKTEDELKRVDSMRVHELGMLHTMFALSRAIMKADGDLAWNSIIERAGLGHIHDGLVQCKAGFIERIVALTTAGNTAWNAEIALLGQDVFVCVDDAEKLQSFIAKLVKVSGTAKVYESVFERNLSPLLDLHTSGEMRGWHSKMLINSALKRGERVFVTGGCPQYSMNAMIELRQYGACSTGTRLVIDANATMVERDTASNLAGCGGASVYHGDVGMESRAVLTVKEQNRQIHRSQINSVGSTLNLDAATTARLEANLFPKGAEDRKWRSSSEHLKQEELVPLLRAAIRSSGITDKIRAEWLGGVGVGGNKFSIDEVPVILSLSSDPRIQRKGRNPELLRREEIAEERAYIHARFALRQQIGGRYPFLGRRMQNFPVVGLFRKNKAEVLSSVSRSRDQCFAALALLSRKGASARALEFPAMLGSQHSGRMLLNGAPKSKLRNVFRMIFGTSHGASNYLETAGAAPSSATGPSQFALTRGDFSDVLNVDTVVLDMAMFMRRLPPTPGATTGAAVVMSALSHVVKRRFDRGVGRVEVVDDIGGCPYKQLTEHKRDTGKGNGAGPKKVGPFDAGKLPTGFTATSLVALYCDRSNGRRQWQRAVFDTLTTSTPQLPLSTFLGSSGIASFSGYGPDAETRGRSHTVDLSTTAWTKSAASNLLEDTNAANKSFAAMLRGETSVLIGEDGDFVQILTLLSSLAYYGWREERPLVAASLGRMFVQMSSQNVEISAGVIVAEEFICCNELAQSINSNPALQCIQTEARVPSIIAAAVCLGGDTTPYMYLPYSLGMECYLMYATYIGPLVCAPSISEAADGFRISIDDEALIRWFKSMYVSKNPTAINNFNSMSISSRIEALKLVTYEDLERIVAKLRFPRITLMMPSRSNLLVVKKLAQARVDSWLRTAWPESPTPRRIGLRFSMIGPGSSMDDDSIQIDEPSSAKLEELATAGYTLRDVEPMFNTQNTPLLSLFGETGLPATADILRGMTAYVASGTKVTFCSKCHHRHRKGSLCQICGSADCKERCECGHPPHKGARCTLCEPFSGRAKCVPKCPLCEHAGKRPDHSKVGCAQCTSTEGPCCIDPTGDSDTPAAIVGSDVDEDDNDAEEESLRLTVQAAVAEGGAEAEATILEVEAAVGMEEITYLVAESSED